jgi:glycogen(starch) synthase
VRVLRVCSVFEPPATVDVGRVARFDPLGGMQNHAGELTRALDALGVRQHVVTSRPPGAARRGRFGRHAVVHRLGWPVPAARQFYSLPALPLVVRLGLGADLVHAHLGEDLAVLPLAAAAARRHRLPLVVTVHTSLRHTLAVSGARSLLLKVLGGGLERRAEHRAAAVIALTPRLAGLLAADGVPADRVHVIPSGVNPVLFAGPLPDPFPDVPRPRVVFVGRLHPQKGVANLVRAAPLLTTAGVQVLLVGDGPDRRRLERLAARAAGPPIRFVGFIPHERVPAALAAADVVVLPSRYEELGSVLLEAMQAGRPVVATAAGGIPDAVRDGVTGLIVPPDRPAELAAAVDRVLGDPALAARLSARARARARDYDWPSLARRVLGVYEQVVAARGAGGR